MLIEKDLSELNDTEKQKLVQTVLTDYAETVAFTAKEFTAKGDSISKEVARQLVGKEDEVLRLRGWVDVIIGQHIGRKQAEAMNRSHLSQSPPEGDESILKRTVASLEELRGRWTKHPPPRIEHLPMLESALGLLAVMSTNFYVRVGGADEAKQR